jgi:hypothetical protein
MPENEIIYFDEKVKGHKLLITSQIIAFKGKRFRAEVIDTISVSEFRQSINAVPMGASYLVSVAARGDEITIDCAKFRGMLWLGARQFQRVESSIVRAAGSRLIYEAIKKLISGERLVFENKGYRLEKRLVFVVSRDGIEIEQTRTLFSNKIIPISWPHLRVSSSNGRMYFQCYSTGKKADVAIWRMPNNVVFSGMIDYLTDKANYRCLEL